ncbi:TPA: restriction endonuclease subunit R [bacterium]|nr:restriction endonuclease subunit R [bacterium]
MEERLLELIKKIQSDRRLASLDEAVTKQTIILRILSLLGWDLFNIDEVHPEYSVGGKKVDYALRHNNYNKAFIEVKKVGEDLDKHQEQLLNYSFQEGVKLAVLTNGITWWFYLPLHEGSWEQRRFYTIEIYDQGSKEITQKFIDFLSKKDVISGNAITNAEGVYKSKQKRRLIEDTLPKAWKKLITEADEILVELIAETTEKLCGYKPDLTAVENFLVSYIPKMEPSIPKVPKQVTPSKEVTIIKEGPSEGEKIYTGKSISAFTFKETRYVVKTWKELLIQICDIIAATHRDRFEQVLNLIGRKRPYFSRNQNELRAPERIEGTDIYVEINLSANSIVKLSRDVLSLFGYTKEDLSIETA